MVRTNLAQIISTKKYTGQKSKKLLIIGISITFLVLIIAITLIIFITKGGDNEEEEEKGSDEEVPTDEEPTDKEIIREIIGQYYIKSVNEETKILGDEFINNS